MKKSIFIAALALVAFASCTKNEVNPVDNDSPIAFQTVVGKVTKAYDGIIGDTTYPTGETFASAAFYHETSGGFSNASTFYVPQSEVKYDTPATGQWSTDISYYWPKNGYLTFFAYSPYKYGANDENTFPGTISAANGVTITDWDVDANQTVDVMIATPVTNQTVSSAPVATVFNHLLAQIVEFKFATTHTGSGAQVNGGLEFFLNELSINDIVYSGDYTSGNTIAAPSASWTTDAAVKDYKWYDVAVASNAAANQISSTANAFASNVEPMKTNGYLLVIPQDLSDTAMLKVVYSVRHWYGTGANDYTTETITVEKKINEINTSDWQKNKKYGYTITVSPGQQILWTPSVAAWDNVDNQSAAI